MSSPIAMRYSPPPEAAGDKISALYELHLSSERLDEVERADRPQLRVLVQGQGRYHFANGHEDDGAALTLLGPTSGPVRVTGQGPMLVCGAGLLPPAWIAMAGAQAENLTDRAIDAVALLGQPAADLLQAMASATSTEERFALISDFIGQMSAHGDSGASEFTAIVDAWLAGSPDPAIDRLIEQTGLGIRQIERLTKRYYGLPPKTLARRYRAIRAASALARGEDIDALGLGDSFYDQSHLIREVKRFAGLTPQQMRKGKSTLQTEVSEGLKSLEGQVPPLISDA
ncbi:AraC family transcriptional regulator [Sphingomonas lacunae]|uniref:AraC family transcriptional regulator n=1 Tax=Sphingomonas lacunae TaxID=2698828 RepID=A0A6M4AQU0_9SPHN|nr:helix-turn-helix domain-containing protein [Sphingomonas lacunae]QJQ31464.1 AraC family transcriptional regulator [Sphingomonas lacunae]